MFELDANHSYVWGLAPAVRQQLLAHTTTSSQTCVSASAALWDLSSCTAVFALLLVLLVLHSGGEESTFPPMQP